MDCSLLTIGAGWLIPVKRGSKLHISERFLPWQHAVGWTVVSAPFLGQSFRTVARKMEQGAETRRQMAAATGLLFVLTALQRPSFAGTCSHAVGVAVGAILLGPRVMTALGLVVSTFMSHTQCPRVGRRPGPLLRSERPGASREPSCVRIALWTRACPRSRYRGIGPRRGNS